LFISAHYLFIVQIVLFAIYLGIYFLADNSSQTFLNKFKYLILLTILLFFFVQIKKDGGYWGIGDVNVSISRIVIFFQSWFLLFIMARADRVSYQNQIVDSPIETPELGGTAIGEDVEKVEMYQMLN
jgi:hypothetical protein